MAQRERERDLHQPAAAARDGHTPTGVSRGGTNTSNGGEKKKFRVAFLYSNRCLTTDCQKQLSPSQKRESVSVTAGMKSLLNILTETARAKCEQSTQRRDK